MRGIVITLTLLALALPAAASAQTVAPGNSGVDQYQENIPGVGGNRPTGGPNSSGTGNGSGAGESSRTGALPTESRVLPTTTQRLEKLGPDGKATAAAAEATAPPRLQASGGADYSGGGADSSGDTGPGMGWALPVILALALAAAVSIAVLRWRRGAPPGAA